MRRLIARGRMLTQRSAASQWARIRGQVRKLLAPKEDKRQLATEKALILSRLDVSEEITRILGHLEESRRTLSSGGAVGTRLNFLCQELQREIQTFSAKSQDLRVSWVAVGLKEALEQVREQVQNIE